MKTPKNCVRLACLICDNEECDGITPAQLKKLVDSGKWHDVFEAQSYDDATADNRDSEWWTHLGDCPHCLAEDEASDTAEEKQRALF